MNNFLLALGLINLSCTLFIIKEVHPSPDAPAPVVEHSVVFLKDEQVVADLNALAAAGRELVTCRRASDGSEYSPSYGYECVLRRVTPAGGHP